jgi:hypothetical protein
MHDYNVRGEVLKIMAIRITVLWNVTMCSFGDKSSFSQDLTASELIYTENGERSSLKNTCVLTITLQGITL